MNCHERSTAEGDLLSCLDWSRRDAVREALRCHPLVHLRAPRLSASDLIEFAKGLGDVEMEPRVNLRLPGSPEILVVGNVRDWRGRVVGGNAVGQGLHSDRSFRKRPPEFTMLYAVHVPSRGGETEFSSLYRLYEECDEETRSAWSTLEVEHETNSSYFDGHPDRRARHPLVPRHPDTGRRLVYASPRYTRRVIGVSAEESDGILQRISASLEHPDIVHRWRPSDILVWDNRALVHRATEYDTTERRELWRLSISVGSSRRASTP
jgi:alpha-ketoglutarate-dependent taurine dioxygenase